MCVYAYDELFPTFQPLLQQLFCFDSCDAAYSIVHFLSKLFSRAHVVPQKRQFIKVLNVRFRDTRCVFAIHDAFWRHNSVYYHRASVFRARLSFFFSCQNTLQNATQHRILSYVDRACLHRVATTRIIFYHCRSLIRKWALYLLANSRRESCKTRHPMILGHPVIIGNDRHIAARGN